MPRQDSNAKKGMEFLLNNPKTNPFTNTGAQGFDALMTATGMSLNDTLKYLGKHKNRKPKDEDTTKKRLDTLEAETEQNTK